MEIHLQAGNHLNTLQLYTRRTEHGDFLRKLEHNVFGGPCADSDVGGRYSRGFSHSRVIEVRFPRKQAKGPVRPAAGAAARTDLARLGEQLRLQTQTRCSLNFASFYCSLWEKPRAGSRSQPCP